MKTDILNGLIALKFVSEKGNFTEAARVMNVSPSAISQTIKQLEKRLGNILVNRTTRSISLTEVGEQFLNSYQLPLAQLLNAMDKLDSFTGKPIGTLKLNLPRLAWSIIIGPVLEGFQKEYPEIIVELYFEDNFTDVIGGGYDAGIRPSEMTAGDMTAIRISPPYRYLVACSPSYLKKYGVPKHPKDLLNHNCILYKTADGHMFKKWKFKEDGHDFIVEVKGKIKVNDPLLMVQCGIKGLGIIYSAQDLIKESIKKKELVLVLEQFALRSDGYYLYYPNFSQVSPKLRAFIDYLKKQKNL